MSKRLLSHTDKAMLGCWPHSRATQALCAQPRGLTPLKKKSSCGAELATPPTMPANRGTKALAAAWQLVAGSWPVNEAVLLA